MAELKGLQDEQDRLESKRKELEDQLNAATDGAERQRILDAQADLDKKIADNKKKQGSKKTSGGSGDDKPAKSKGGVSVTKTDDPLDGL